VAAKAATLFRGGNEPSGSLLRFGNQNLQIVQTDAPEKML